MTDGLGNPQSVLVLGGGSDIAAATLRRLVARRTRRIVLAARRTDSLSALRAELEAAGAKVDAVVFDADDTDSHPQAIADAFDRSGPFDMVLVFSSKGYAWTWMSPASVSLKMKVKASSTRSVPNQTYLQPCGTTRSPKSVA